MMYACVCDDVHVYVMCVCARDDAHLTLHDIRLRICIYVSKYGVFVWHLCSYVYIPKGNRQGNNSANSASIQVFII